MKWWSHAGDVRKAGHPGASLLRRSSSKQKRLPDVVREPCEWKANYFAPRIASFAAFATRNFTTRLAGIWIVAPVIGLRP